MPEIYRLQLKIALKRQRMVEEADKYGRNDPRVLRRSRELDRLIVEFQKKVAVGE